MVFPFLPLAILLVFFLEETTVPLFYAKAANGDITMNTVKIANDVPPGLVNSPLFQNALAGAIAGMVVGSRRSLEGAMVRGMAQGAAAGAVGGILGGAVAGGQPGALVGGLASGYLGSRGPLGPSRPQIHVRVDRDDSDSEKTGARHTVATRKYKKRQAKNKANFGMEQTAPAAGGGEEKISSGDITRGDAVAELAGLGLIAGPVAHTLYLKHFKHRDPTEREQTVHHVADLAGLGVLAAPYAKRLMQRGPMTGPGSAAHNARHFAPKGL